MQKIIITGCHFGSLGIFLLAIDAPMALLRFLLVGELPGGFLTLGANAMLIVIGLAAALLLAVAMLHALGLLRASQRASSLPRRRYMAIQ